jgi:hypothetical protein
MVVTLLAVLGSSEVLQQEQVASVFSLSEIPEILSARIQHIEELGKSLVEARKSVSEQYAELADIVLEQTKAKIENPFADPWQVPEGPPNDEVSEAGEIKDVAKEPKRKLH